MSIRDEVNLDIVSVYVDESHEDMGWHKGIRFFFQNPTVDLIATYDSELFQ